MGFFWLVGEGMRHALQLHEAPPEQLGGGSVARWTTLRLAYPLKPLTLVVRYPFKRSRQPELIEDQNIPNHPSVQRAQRARCRVVLP